jgi:hypothetical protein
MTELEVKKEKKVDNSSYRERFQFQLQVNDNIIVQRYFKIPKFNPNSLASEEFYDVLDEVVKSIQNDLVSKSRIYLNYMYEDKTKLVGFASKKKALKDAIDNNCSEGEIRHILLRDEVDDEYVYHTIKEWDETEFVNYGEVTFKFVFMVDDRTIYERIWDGSQYPKYVRNSVDITNAKSYYPMIQLMNSGKNDLVVETINKICNICSYTENDESIDYTKSSIYGVDKQFAKVSNINKNTQKKYSFSIYDKEYINSWRVYCNQKYGKIVE